jgi:hypothetical protein
LIDNKTTDPKLWFKVEEFTSGTDAFTLVTGRIELKYSFRACRRNI